MTTSASAIELQTITFNVLNKFLNDDRIFSFPSPAELPFLVSKKVRHFDRLLQNQLQQDEGVAVRQRRRDTKLAERKRDAAGKLAIHDQRNLGLVEIASLQFDGDEIKYGTGSSGDVTVLDAKVEKALASSVPDLADEIELSVSRWSVDARKGQRS